MNFPNTQNESFEKNEKADVFSKVFHLNKALDYLLIYFYQFWVII